MAIKLHNKSAKLNDFYPPSLFRRRVTAKLPGGWKIRSICLLVDLKYASIRGIGDVKY